MLIQRAQIYTGAGWQELDLRVRGARVAQIAARLGAEAGEQVVRAEGGALLPGLHDHHIHLMSLAADLASLKCGPPDVNDAESLEGALRQAAARTEEGAWIRGTGYHESVAGDLDRRQLDVWLPDRPCRIQHRSGAAWIVNGEGLRQLGLAAGEEREAPGPAGVERDERGRATGRLFRLDAWLRRRLSSQPPRLDEVGRRLSRCGVTGVSDATEHNGPEAFDLLAAARQRGELPQRLHVMGAVELADCRAPQGVSVGNHKIVLDEAALPDPGRLEQRIRVAHDARRGVAIHCVTRSELVLALHCLEQAGPQPGDRIEHAAVAPPELEAWMARLGVRVVTQPNFVYERGDDYLRDVDAADRPWLYRAAGLVASGIQLAGGTDAPFGDPDPWLAMRAAVDRRTRGGQLLGELEAVHPEAALGLFCGSPAESPGIGTPQLRPGAAADLCLLRVPWERARSRLDSSDVVTTVVAGRVAFAAE
jgi:predicted amidohydrolase YtcJ